MNKDVSDLEPADRPRLIVGNALASLGRSVSLSAEQV